jgi:hypothetical protein
MRRLNQQAAFAAHRYSRLVRWSAIQDLLGR